MNPTKIINERVEFIKAMNAVMFMVSDESAYDQWREIIPYDNKQEQGIIDIASSEDETVFSNAVCCFNRIIRDYDFFNDITGLKDGNNAEMLKGMHRIMCQVNDESAYYIHWIYYIPDEADDEELEDIAQNDDETFNDAVKCFKRCVKRYACKSGYYIASNNAVFFGKTYGVIEEYSDDDE